MNANEANGQPQREESPLQVRAVYGPELLEAEPGAALVVVCTFYPMPIIQPDGRALGGDLRGLFPVKDTRCALPIAIAALQHLHDAGVLTAALQAFDGILAARAGS